MMSSSTSLQFFVNGKLVSEDKPNSDRFLANYLRRKVGLTGTKVACGEGGCGSCTVLLSRFDTRSKQFTHGSVNACITPISSLHGCHILTIEGVGGNGPTSKSCHFLQDAIAKGNGTQCGFCTPGMVMSVHGLMSSKEKVNVDDIKTALHGNLCRCTGYRPILESFRNCFEVPIEELPNCSPCLEDKRAIQLDASTSFSEIETLLKNFHSNNKNPMTFESGNQNTWFTPKSMQELYENLQKNPEITIVGGSSELGLEGQLEHGNFIHTGHIAEMKAIHVGNDSVRFGAAVTISEMTAQLQNVVPKLADWKARPLVTILNLLERFGSTQIRNVVTLGGSLMCKNPASDIQTLFAALKCRVVCSTTDSKDTFLTTTKLLQIKSNVIVIAVEIPFSAKTQYTWAHKVMRRNVNDASAINCSILVTLNEDYSRVEETCVSFGGRLIERFQLNLKPNEDQSLFTQGGFMKHLRESTAQNLRALETKDTTYCQTLAKNLCTKFGKWLTETTTGGTPDENKLPKGFKSMQTFDKTSGNQSSTDLVGKPISHASAYKHATGEARFLDDIPKHKNELAMAFVLSERPHAFIRNVDLSEALALQGVVGYVSHKDISSPEKNRFGLVVKDEEIFASEKVNCIGQIIGGIVATSRSIAAKAVKLVRVEYGDIKPCLFTIEDAIKHSSFYSDFGIQIENGNCNQNFGQESLKGKFEIGSQAHFYMETQGCLAIPNGEDGEMEIVSSTQNPMDTQLQVAGVVDVPANRIVVKVKRVGGGFGGKEARSLMVALPAAIAARKFRSPVRCILDRQTDMLVSGKRNPFLVDFSVDFTKEGRILALRLKIYCNAGHSLDVSNAAIERCLINVDNAYNIPNFSAEGFVCKTNVASNTVFRGTGAPQAALIIENIVDLIATKISRDPADVRKINLYSTGDVTPYGQTLINSTVKQCWDECIRAANYASRIAEIGKFNKQNEWKKRGISVNPIHMGIAYTAVFLNQASALINVYRDGSVLLSHGGVEIGQGLHSKMIQVATRELGISSDKIRILETATDKVPNGTPTSASSSSDLNGMAVLDACQKLMNRLKPYKALEPNLSWEELVLKAYMDRISLASTGYYKTPGIGWNEVTKKGNAFNYFSTGAACSEVELDCLTGQYQLIRTDIVMDVGQSLNPAIDLGQIEGAFMQGVGFYTIEDLKFSPEGAVETLGPNTYKIPTAADIPLEFNVSFLSGSANPRAVYSSKTVGEPPLLLATSVFSAIRDAIRNKLGHGRFELNSPATAERILMALQENL